MGRGYIVEEVVEKYLANLQAAVGTCLTGLLIGQCSLQRDFVVLAVQTPHRESEGQSESRGASSLDAIDMEWVTEHARQVSRMLPGGLSILGVFLITPSDLAKEAQNTLRRLVFAIEKHVTKGRLWDLSEDDVTDRVTLHICSKTRKAVCKTFDVKDPKCSAKPADWKYQSGASLSWPMLTCSVELGLHIPVTGTSLENMDRCMKDGLKTWAQQIGAGICLLNGKQLADEADLIPGAKKNTKMTQQTFRAQILVSAIDPQGDQRSTALVQACSGSLTINGTVHCRAYIHTNKPKAKQAIEALKRDIMNTIFCRAEMLLEDLLMNEGESKGPASGQQSLPHRVFAPLPGTGLCVCDYMFPDETTADVAERFKEMLDRDTAEEEIDTSLEPSQAHASVSSGVAENTPDGPLLDSPHLTPTDASKSQGTFQHYVGAAVAAGIALLVTATSLLYLSD
ncbi:protein odr-4 homolog [Chanos chanos]|uniref:Protein odr-4 homolog n=1 Tax=Chanos chanos TaxID=29144 RepID=A0A6J2VIU2_CHACN|nr:protein odr-4 homolog [Chanos chanos]